MSDLKERSEKNCLNCNAVVHERYCGVCGQENLYPQESAWHLVTHFFNDITHFDGKLFSTLKYLITKPGFLSSEYKAGRRSSYLSPVRMYMFTSAIFFLIFFSAAHIGKERKGVNPQGKETSPVISVRYNKFGDTTRTSGIHLGSADFKSKAEYDSLRKAGKINDNWFERMMAYKSIEIKEKYKNDQGKIQEVILENLVHSFPQMLFISLPLFAFMLKLLYFRHKDFYFTAHAVAGIHLYVFVFILLLLNMGLQELKNNLHWEIFNWIIAMVFIYLFYYEYKVMRMYYRQRRGKTILKYFLLNTGMLMVIILLFAVFTLLSILKI